MDFDETNSKNKNRSTYKSVPVFIYMGSEPKSVFVRDSGDCHNNLIFILHSILQKVHNSKSAVHRSVHLHQCQDTDLLPHRRSALHLLPVHPVRNTD